MYNCLFPYERMDIYKKSIHYLQNHNSKITYYIGNEDQPSSNETLNTWLQTTLKQVKLTLHTLSLVRYCFHYEYQQYKQQPILSPTDKADMQYCKSLNHTLMRIIQSSISTKNYLTDIQHKIPNYYIAKNSTLYFAIRKACQVQKDRHVRLRHEILSFYISVSMIRPYCKHLQKHNQTLAADMKRHFDTSQWIEYKDLEPILHNYAKEIAAIAKMDETQTYKQCRLEDALAYQSKLEQNKKERAVTAEQKQMERWKSQLTRHCIERESALHTTYKGELTSHSYESLLHQIASRTKDMKTCHVICMLVKEPDKTRKFRYLTQDGCTNRMGEVDLFLETADIPEDLKQRAMSYDNVKCIDTILIY